MIKLLQQRNILILTFCQILFWITLMAGISVTSLVGAMLATNSYWATVPFGFLVLTGILVTRPASMLMQKFGRRLGFLVGAAAGILGFTVCAFSVFYSDFLLFCAGSSILGIYQAIGMYYRLAAADAVDVEQRSHAISLVMLGGVVAAIFAPGLAVWSKTLLNPYVFAGTFVFLSILCAIVFLALTLFKEQKVAEVVSQTGGRSMKEIFRQPVMIMAVLNAAVAQGIMILVMLVTPKAMEVCGIVDAKAANVMQLHFLGMFVPSFFTGRLISRFGAPNVAMAGVLTILTAIAIAASGITFLNFGIALLLLGVGWNFMHVSGTTMVTYAHRPEERGRVQGVSETIALSVSAVASFASGGIFNGFGWTVVNLGAIPVLVISLLLTWRLAQSGQRQDFKPT